MNLPIITVKHSGVIHLNYIEDFPDGNLIVGEQGKNIPFEIKRVYSIYNFLNPTARRGMHAHKTLDQVIFCLKGSFILELDDGTTVQSIQMNDPRWGVLLGARLWHSMSQCSPDCIMLVLAGDYYKESDYIRDYEEFIQFIHA